MKALCSCVVLVGLLAPGSALGVPDAQSWDVNNPNYSVSASRVEIDVAEGTWMNLDVSPDGQTIVFDFLGDIYRLPIEGGDAVNLTSSHAWDIQPRFSPDGSALAFTSDRAGGDNIWTMNLSSGDYHQVTYETFRLLNNPTWSLDGKFIAARKHFTTSRSLGTGEIWLYYANAADKQAGQQLVERPSEAFQKELGEPMFTADGKGLYFVQNVTPGNTFIYHQDSNTELFQIREVDLADNSIAKVVGGPGGAVRPTPSPDGTKLAYVKRVRAKSRLFVMDLASQQETMIFDALDPDLQETWAVQGVYPNMDWTPDSKAVVFWADGKIWRIDVASQKVSEIPFRIRDSRKMYPPPRFTVDVAPDTFTTKMVRFARPSPDRKAVVFESLGQLHIKKGDRAAKRLTSDKNDGFDFSPIWAPDGDQVFFLRWSDTNLATLHRIGTSGGKSKLLELPKGQYTELAISNEGNTLAFRKLAGSSLLNPEWGGRPGIYLMDLSTGEARFVSKRGSHPHFGPNQRIYVQERAETAQGRGAKTAKTRLLSMTQNGNDVREIAEVANARSLQLSPMGTHIAFVDNFQIHIAPFFASGKLVVLDKSKAAKTMPVPVVKVSSSGGTYLNWSADGKRVNWSVGSQMKTVSVDDALESGFVAPTSGRDLSIEVPFAKPESRFALVNARIITMNGDREVIEKGAVLVEHNRIKAIGDVRDVKVPKSYTTIDMSGKTVIPGLIDIHAHGPYGSGQIIPQQNWNLMAHLALGVTTVHNPSSAAHLAFAAAEYVSAGLTLGPRIYSTGEIVYGAKGTNYNKIESLEDALAHIRRLKAQGAISVKNYNQPRREQRQQVIEAARQEGLMSVAEGGSLFSLDMNFIADGITGIEHNVPILNMYDDVTQFWRHTPVAYTPTLVVTYGGLTSEDYFYQHTEVWKHPILSNFVPPGVLQARSVRRPMAPEEDYKDDDAAAAAKVLLDAGIMVNIGAHGQREGLGSHWEMWSFVRGGFSPMEALSAATINPAQYMGMNNDIGSLEVGKLADMVVLNENPLSDIRHTDQIDTVVINGRIYDAATLNERHTGDAVTAPLYWQGRPEAGIR
jgi:imidazolonepropionase-like amidohydrolase/Tol biopolymer transport system component